MTDVELRLTADLGQATKEVAGFRKEYQDMVRAVEKPLRQIDALQKTQESAKAASAEFFAAKNRVDQLKAAISQAGQPVAHLDRELVRAERTLARATTAFDRQKESVRQQRAELRAAGIDTTKLAAEQRRLNAELSAGLTAGRNDQAVAGIRARSAALAQVVREQRAANLEQARQNLGVNRYRELQSQLGRVRAEYQLLRTSGKLTAQELSIAQRNMTQRVRETQRALRDMNSERRQASGISQLGSGIGGAIGAIGAGYSAVSAISYVSRTADAYNLMNARLRLATSSQEEFNVAQRELSRIAQSTEAPLQSLVTLYGRISRPLRDAGRSQADILRLTEAVSISFRVSGATAQEAENGVIQFAQALGAGALRGEEFNSVAEQAPRLMQALADGIGVPVGALKEMAAQGELTAAVVTDALTGQLEALRTEAETLPDTVGGAMMRLRNVMNEAVGGTNVQPLIDQIRKLSDASSEPAVQRGIQTLTGWMVKLSAATTGLVADLARLGPEFGGYFAALTGNMTELDRLDARIKMLRQSLEAPTLNDSIFNTLTGTSEEDLQAELDMLTKARAKLIEDQTGLNEEMQFLAEVAQAAAEEARIREVDSFTKYVGDIETLRKSQIKAAEDGAKALASAEKKAIGDLQKVRDERLKIEERYQAALAGLGTQGGASYGAAQALKVGARQALQAGDVAGAQQQAQAALKMLQDLAAAGENTYGFGGFIQELQAIELAANDIEQTNAENKIAEIGASIAALKDQAEQLKEMPVSVKADEASIDQVRSQIQALAQLLGQTEIVIPVRVAMPDAGAPAESAAAPAVPGYAGGGWTGPGSKYQPAGVVHADEHVQPKRVVNEPGALPFLERIRRNGFANTISQLQQRISAGMKGYAEGGLVGNRIVPSIPPLAQALQQQLSGPGFSDLGRLDLRINGESTTIYVDQPGVSNLRRTTAKFGRPIK